MVVVAAGLQGRANGLQQILQEGLPTRGIFAMRWFSVVTVLCEILVVALSAP